MNTYEAAGILFANNISVTARFYEHVAEMSVFQTEEDHAVLGTGSFRLIVHKIPDRLVQKTDMEAPLRVREGTAIKLSFCVDDLAQARETAAAMGGVLYGREHEWRYGSMVVCDGHDPEGNVFQLFQPSMS